MTTRAEVDALIRRAAQLADPSQPPRDEPVELLTEIRDLLREISEQLSFRDCD